MKARSWRAWRWVRKFLAWVGRHRPLIERRLATLALIAVAVVGEWVLQHRVTETLRSSQIASCERGNDSRRQQNAMKRELMRMLPGSKFTLQAQVDCERVVDHPPKSKP